jgi:hypothetical protein
MVGAQEIEPWINPVGVFHHNKQAPQRRRATDVIEDGI